MGCMCTSNKQIKSQITKENVIPQIDKVEEDKNEKVIHNINAPINIINQKISYINKDSKNVNKRDNNDVLDKKIINKSTNTNNKYLDDLLENINKQNNIQLDSLNDNNMFVPDNINVNINQNNNANKLFSTINMNNSTNNINAIMLESTLQNKSQIQKELNTDMIKEIEELRNKKLEGVNYKHIFKNKEEVQQEGSTIYPSTHSESEFEKIDIINQLISECFSRKISIFKCLNNTLKMKIIRKFRKLKFEDGDIIYAQGVPARFVYIIISGFVDLYKDNISSKTFSKNNLFGIEALTNFLKKPREFTAISHETSNIFAIPRDHYFFQIWEYSRKKFRDVYDDLCHSLLIKCQKKLYINIIASYISNIENDLQYKLIDDLDLLNNPTSGDYEFLYVRKGFTFIDPTLEYNTDAAIYIIHNGEVEIEYLNDNYEPITESFSKKKRKPKDLVNQLNMKLYQDEEDSEDIIVNKTKLSFGEDTLLLKHKFPYKVKAFMTDLEVIKIKPKFFVNLYGSKYSDIIHYYIIKNAFQQHPRFRKLDEEFLRKIILHQNIFKAQRINKDSPYFNSAVPPDKIMIVLCGYLYVTQKVTKNAININKNMPYEEPYHHIILEPYQLNFTKHMHSEYSIKPEEVIRNSDNFMCLNCYYSEIETLLNERLQTASENHLAINLLKENKVFSNFNFSKLQVLVNERENRFYIEKDNVILSPDAEVDFIVVILKGSVKITKVNEPNYKFHIIYPMNTKNPPEYSSSSEGSEVVIHENYIFGLKNIFFPEKGFEMLKLTQSTNVSIIYKSAFERLTKSKDDKKLTDKISSSNPKKINRSNTLINVTDETTIENFLHYLKETILLNDYNFSIDDFIFLKHIKSQDYYDLTLARHKKNEELYFIKIFPRNKIQNRADYMKMIEQERNLCSSILNPFIVSYLDYFKQDDNIFFVYDFDNGKTLFEYFEDYNKLPDYKDVTKYYVTSIIQACDYLHSFNIVHRNIHPKYIFVSKSVSLYILLLYLYREYRS